VAKVLVLKGFAGGRSTAKVLTFVFPARHFTGQDSNSGVVDRDGSNDFARAAISAQTSINGA
jgi:hypothetical protein